VTGLCAICTNDGDGAVQLLDGREVFVCVRCEEEHPRHGGYDAGSVGRCTPHAVNFSGLAVGCNRSKTRHS
jgi:hypothetical protein